MLILSRKLNQKIVIDNGRIVIQVTSIEDNSVRLGIAAPAEVPIHREEVFERIHGNHDRASHQEPQKPQ